MVKISDAQAKHLAALQQARATLDSNTATLEAYVKAQREQLKQPVREAVAAALDAGIPARQVALKGLGYADVGSLKQYLDTGNNGRMLAPQPFNFAPSADSAPAPREFELKEHNADFEMITYVVVGDPSVEADIFYTEGNHTFQSAKRRQNKTGITDAEVDIVDTLGKNLIDNMYQADFTREYYEED